ncbi:MAG: hypothetical protein OIN88_00935 [Candidatus Methanoperedens sp.]|nr:hypothetical protein [Candidatus Methanoperedens sp.]MCZ7360300.1 hypothetical protein [Candidatus Methanoperedens sp.]HLB69910.1 hypothetical protein [Candidatus Methanoperedens sp.]
MREIVLNADEFPMEPASELLRRIGEERVKLEQKKGRDETPGFIPAFDDIQNLMIQYNLTCPSKG